MSKTILVIQGHPDNQADHLCHGLARAYLSGAHEGGHAAETLVVADLKLPLLQSEAEFNSEASLDAVKHAQAMIHAADHVVLIYPLWLGTMPALLKGFLEQTLRPSFAFDYSAKGLPIKKLKGKSARVIVTMGMPAMAYRWFFGAHSLKSLERNILKFCGMTPVRHTLFGTVGSASAAQRDKWLTAARQLGRRAR